MTLPKVEGELQIRTAIAVGTFAGSVITMPVGNYFWNSIGNGGATRTFLLELKNQLDTATGRTWTLTLDDTNDTSTGKVTISCTGAATTATWDAGGVIEAALGFTANLASGTTWTGVNQAKYLWLPNCGRSGALSPQAGTGAAVADYTAAIAPDGTPSILAYAKRSHDTFDFRTVLDSKMHTVNESTVNEALETYWRSVVSLGLRTRFHKDRATDATYRTWAFLNGGEFNPVAFDENWTDGVNSIWSVRYDVGETQ